jgi:Ras-related protein Rab-6A
MFMETSAKAGHNVKSLFKKIAMSLPGMDQGNVVSTENPSASGVHFSALLI